MDSTGLGAIVVCMFALIGYYGRLFFPYAPPKIVGIDLGTSYSSAAVFNNGFSNVSVIKNKEGSKLIPSIVTIYQNGSILVGRISPISDSSKHVVYYDSKRFIGVNDVSEEKFQEIRSKYPYELELENGSIYYVLPKDFQIPIVFQGRRISPEQISSLILSHIMTLVQASLGYRPHFSVVGVPVEFNELQRSSTIEAAEKVGLCVKRLVNEPTAASMACNVHKKPEIEYVVVFDLGGGTLDVSLLYSKGGILSTLSIAGNDRLGGRDFTQNLIQFVRSQSSSNTQFVDFEQHNFNSVVEAAKITLSFYNSTVISFYKNSTLENITVTRSQFEQVNHNEFMQLLEPINVVLRDASLLPRDVHEIVLVGGATRMPKVRQVLSQYFGREPNNEVDPDVAVVTGLAIQAGIMSQGWPLEVSAIDVIPRKITKLKT